ncbi:MAG: excisionase family DNA-binding protein [Microthrixaceae bacterium]|nr:excisionase family DNA-binding protein [Microthrixaceae bacterium]
MTAVFHTVEGHALSSADRDHVAEFTQQVHAASNLPEAVRDAIAVALDLVADGHDVTVLEAATHLSPNDAARIVGVSRPLFNRILDEGRIAFFETDGGHRKIKLAAIRAYIEERDEIAAQLAAARAARRSDGEIIAEELGLDAETAKRLGIT